MKKGMVLAVCLFLAGMLCVNGSFAMPTWDELFADLVGILGVDGTPETSTMFQTHLVTKVRSENGNLVAAPQNPTLIPSAVGGSDSWPLYDTAVEGKTYPLWSEQDVGGVMDKFVFVTNESQGNENDPNNAYFRIAFAVQKEIYPYMYLNFNTADGRMLWSSWKEITTSDGRSFMMKVATFSEMLRPGETSPAALMQVAVDYRITNEVVAQLDGDFLQIRVMSIDADSFVVQENGEPRQMGAVEALGLALPMDTLNPF